MGKNESKEAVMEKSRIREVVEGLPEEVNVVGLIEKLYLLKRLELAEEEITEGKMVPQEEIEKRFASWLE
jgi:hypothetical protein